MDCMNDGFSARDRRGRQVHEVHSPDRKRARCLTSDNSVPCKLPEPAARAACSQAACEWKHEDGDVGQRQDMRHLHAPVLTSSSQLKAVGTHHGQRMTQHKRHRRSSCSRSRSPIRSRSPGGSSRRAATAVHYSPPRGGSGGMRTNKNTGSLPAVASRSSSPACYRHDGNTHNHKEAPGALRRAARSHPYESADHAGRGAQYVQELRAAPPAPSHKVHSTAPTHHPRNPHQDSRQPAGDSARQQGQTGRSHDMARVTSSSGATHISGGRDKPREWVSQPGCVVGHTAGVTARDWAAPCDKRAHRSRSRERQEQPYQMGSRTTTDLAAGVAAAAGPAPGRNSIPARRGVPAPHAIALPTTAAEASPITTAGPTSALPTCASVLGRAQPLHVCASSLPGRLEVHGLPRSSAPRSACSFVSGLLEMFGLGVERVSSMPRDCGRADCASSSPAASRICVVLCLEPGADAERAMGVLSAVQLPPPLAGPAEWLQNRGSGCCGASQVDLAGGADGAAAGSAADGHVRAASHTSPAPDPEAADTGSLNTSKRTNSATAAGALQQEPAAAPEPVAARLCAADPCPSPTPSARSPCAGSSPCGPPPCARTARGRAHATCDACGFVDDTDVPVQLDRSARQGARSLSPRSPPLPACDNQANSHSRSPPHARAGSSEPAARGSMAAATPHPLRKVHSTPQLPTAPQVQATVTGAEGKPRGVGRTGTRPPIFATAFFKSSLPAGGAGALAGAGPAASAWSSGRPAAHPPVQASVQRPGSSIQNSHSHGSRRSCDGGSSGNSRCMASGTQQGAEQLAGQDLGVTVARGCDQVHDAQAESLAQHPASVPQAAPAPEAAAALVQAQEPVQQEQVDRNASSLLDIDMTDVLVQPQGPQGIEAGRQSAPAAVEVAVDVELQAPSSLTTAELVPDRAASATCLHGHAPAEGVSTAAAAVAAPTSTSEGAAQVSLGLAQEQVCGLLEECCQESVALLQAGSQPAMEPSSSVQTLVAVQEACEGVAAATPPGALLQSTQDLPVAQPPSTTAPSVPTALADQALQHSPDSCAGPDHVLLTPAAPAKPCMPGAGASAGAGTGQAAARPQPVPSSLPQLQQAAQSQAQTLLQAVQGPSNPNNEAQQQQQQQEESPQLLSQQAELLCGGALMDDDDDDDVFDELLRQITAMASSPSDGSTQCPSPQVLLSAPAAPPAPPPPAPPFGCVTGPRVCGLMSIPVPAPGDGFGVDTFFRQPMELAPVSVGPSTHARITAAATAPVSSFMQPQPLPPAPDRPGAVPAAPAVGRPLVGVATAAGRATFGADLRALAPVMQPNAGSLAQPGLLLPNAAPTHGPAASAPTATAAGAVLTSASLQAQLPTGAGASLTVSVPGPALGLQHVVLPRDSLVRLAQTAQLPADAPGFFVRALCPGMYAQMVAAATGQGPPPQRVAYELGQVERAGLMQDSRGMPVVLLQLLLPSGARRTIRVEEVSNEQPLPHEMSQWVSQSSYPTPSALAVLAAKRRALNS